MKKLKGFFVILFEVFSLISNNNYQYILESIDMLKGKNNVNVLDGYVLSQENNIPFCGTSYCRFPIIEITPSNLREKEKLKLPTILVVSGFSSNDFEASKDVMRMLGKADKVTLRQNNSFLFLPMSNPSGMLRNSDGELTPEGLIQITEDFPVNIHQTDYFRTSAARIFEYIFNSHTIITVLIIKHDDKLIQPILSVPKTNSTDFEYTEKISARLKEVSKESLEQDINVEFAETLTTFEKWAMFYDERESNAKETSNHALVFEFRANFLEKQVINDRKKTSNSKLFSLMIGLLKNISFFSSPFIELFSSPRPIINTTQIESIFPSVFVFSLKIYGCITLEKITVNDALIKKVNYIYDKKDGSFFVDLEVKITNKIIIFEAKCDSFLLSNVENIPRSHILRARIDPNYSIISSRSAYFSQRKVLLSIIDVRNNVASSFYSTPKTVQLLYTDTLQAGPIQLVFSAKKNHIRMVSRSCKGSVVKIPVSKYIQPQAVQENWNVIGWPYLWGRSLLISGCGPSYESVLAPPLEEPGLFLGSYRAECDIRGPLQSWSNVSVEKVLDKFLRIEVVSSSCRLKYAKIKGKIFPLILIETKKNFSGQFFVYGGIFELKTLPQLLSVGCILGSQLELVRQKSSFGKCFLGLSDIGSSSKDIHELAFSNISYGECNKMCVVKVLSVVSAISTSLLMTYMYAAWSLLHSKV